MKTDKFNYTARIVYECPCCAHQWRDEKKDYCPNCEVRMLYVERPTLSHGEVTKILAHFLDSLRDYEHESHNLIGHDERESMEFVEIYLKNNPDICQLVPKAVSVNFTQVEDIFNQHQIDVMRMSRGEISEGHLMELTNKLISRLAPKQVSEMKIRKVMTNYWDMNHPEADDFVNELIQSLTPEPKEPSDAQQRYIESCKLIPEDYEEHEMTLIHIDYLHKMLMKAAGTAPEQEEGGIK